MSRSVRFSMAVALGLLILGCSSATTTSSVGTTAVAGTIAPSGTTVTPGGTTAGNGPSSSRQFNKYDRSIQTQLHTVGCHAGRIDGVIGPETDAAIMGFQRGAGLKVDGQLGPETVTALKKDSESGKKVCADAGTTTTTTGGGASTTLASTPASTTASTVAAGDGAPCTAAAIAAALGAATRSVNLESYVCSGNYAAGTQQGAPPQFILKAQGREWSPMGQPPCGTASAGLPPIILEVGCPPTGK